MSISVKFIRNDWINDIVHVNKIHLWCFCFLIHISYDAGLFLSRLWRPMSLERSNSSLRRLIREAFLWIMRGECKEFFAKYMLCLSGNKYNNSNCRQESKDYLSCRMDKGLMAKEEWKNLGLDDVNKVDATSKTWCLNVFCKSISFLLVYSILHYVSELKWTKNRKCCALKTFNFPNENVNRCFKFKLYKLAHQIHRSCVQVVMVAWNLHTVLVSLLMSEMSWYLFLRYNLFCPLPLRIFFLKTVPLFYLSEGTWKWCKFEVTRFFHCLLLRKDGRP